MSLKHPVIKANDSLSTMSCHDIPEKNTVISLSVTDLYKPLITARSTGLIPFFKVDIEIINCIFLPYEERQNRLSLSP